MRRLISLLCAFGLHAQASGPSPAQLEQMKKVSFRVEHKGKVPGQDEEATVHSALALLSKGRWFESLGIRRK